MDFSDLFILIGKTLFSYFFLMIILKIMGKRELSQISMFDVVIFLIVSELFSLSLSDENKSLWHFVVPLVVIVILELLSAFLSLKSNKIRNFFEGESTFLIYDGKINYLNMRKNKYNISNLMIQLRNKDIQSPLEVAFAILESNGNLNIIKKENCILKHPDPVIMDGKINDKVLSDLGLTYEDILIMISKYNYILVEDIFFMQILDDSLYIVDFKSLNNK